MNEMKFPSTLHYSFLYLYFPFKKHFKNGIAMEHITKALLQTCRFPLRESLQTSSSSWVVKPTAWEKSRARTSLEIKDSLLHSTVSVPPEPPDP